MRILKNVSFKVFEIRDIFAQYDTDHSGRIQRQQLKSVLTNFGFHAMSGREIDEELLSLDVRSNQNEFVLQDIINIVTKKW